MRALAIGLTTVAALVLAGFLAAGADAMPRVPAPAHSSPVEAVGCNKAGVCPLGAQRVCNNRGRCWCASCGRVGVVGPVVRPFGFVVRPVVRPLRWARPWRWR
jgi:hypothetical protein